MALVRFKQLFSAVTSRLSVKDHHFIKEHLNCKEQKLFEQMDIPTQRHCLNVAYTCLELLKNYPGANKNTLIKAALLHDCGKKAGEVATWHRVAIVLTYFLFPPAARYLQRRGKYKKSGSLARAFYIHSIHAQRGCVFAQRARLDPEVISLIRHHHDKYENDSIELKLLQMSDNAN
ncbi:putative nucleotidyltransferase with HDIG domain [Desulfohalotomaculum tongense]|uniref:HD domain-containing protein n=1 Tax=Desulforadius tongensis TaxID=1216062 RepID=UPI001959CF67|nr:HD domain-containing protein [Desulforadius tongensis]MBM7854485.1 putative nucleotidyltransferase with HDIG domain [Desulforadius tongensis]